MNCSREKFSAFGVDWAYTSILYSGIFHLMQQQPWLMRRVLTMQTTNAGGCSFMEEYLKKSRAPPCFMGMYVRCTKHGCSSSTYNNEIRFPVSKTIVHPTNLNQAVEGRGVVIIKREESIQQGVQQHPQTPDISLGPYIRPTSDQLQGGRDTVLQTMFQIEKQWCTFLHVFVQRQFLSEDYEWIRSCYFCCYQVQLERHHSLPPQTAHQGWGKLLFSWSGQNWGAKSDQSWSNLSLHVLYAQCSPQQMSIKLKYAVGCKLYMFMKSKPAVYVSCVKNVSELHFI